MSPTEVPSQVVGHFHTGRTVCEVFFKGSSTLLRRVEPLIAVLGSALGCGALAVPASLHVRRLTTESTAIFT